jgi:hypothetical protein
MLCIYSLPSLIIIVPYAGIQEKESLEQVSNLVMTEHDSDLPHLSWKDLRPD